MDKQSNWSFHKISYLVNIFLPQWRQLYFQSFQIIFIFLVQIFNKGGLENLHIALTSGSISTWNNTQGIFTWNNNFKYQIDCISTASNPTTFLYTPNLNLSISSSSFSSLALSLCLPHFLSTRGYLNIFISP